MTNEFMMAKSLAAGLFSGPMPVIPTPGIRCVHCALVPEGQVHSHDIIAMCAGTVDRAWFNTDAIQEVREQGSEWWTYGERRLIQTMTLRVEGTQYIWKLTSEYGDDVAGWWSGYGSMRLGVWAD